MQATVQHPFVCHCRQENSQGGEPQKYLSTLQKLPPEQPSSVTDHTMQILREAQVPVVLWPPHFQQINSKGSKAPARPQKKSAPHTPLFPVLQKLRRRRKRAKRLHQEARQRHLPVAPGSQQPSPPQAPAASRVPGQQPHTTACLFLCPSLFSLAPASPACWAGTEAGAAGP